MFFAVKRIDVPIVAAVLSAQFAECRHVGCTTHCNFIEDHVGTVPLRIGRGAFIDTQRTLAFPAYRMLLNKLYEVHGSSGGGSAADAATTNVASSRTT